MTRCTCDLTRPAHTQTVCSDCAAHRLGRCDTCTTPHWWADLFQQQGPDGRVTELCSKCVTTVRAGEMATEGTVPTSPPPSMPPDSPTAEPRSSRFTVLDVLFRVERDGRRYVLTFDNVDTVRYGNDGNDCLIGVSGIDVSEAMDLDDMARGDGD